MPSGTAASRVDDTCDAVHGHQQLSLFHAHYDTRCFLPVRVYHVESGKPVAVLLRPGKTPSGPEVRTLLKHLVRRIRRHWPRTRIVFRGDSHYGRAEAMAWCEENGVDYIFGLAGNRALHALAYEVADDVRVRRAEAGADRMRSFADFAYAARSWSHERRVVARLEATARGFDARYIVTSLSGEARRLYEDIYCARGQAENLIKMHKGQLASDRTSCQSPLANQLRLVLHTAAYWLMLTLRDAIPRAAPLARAEFATLRLRLLKIGARVIEKATRVRIHFTSACPDAGVRPSTGSVGDCYDNAMCESFFATLECELLERRSFRSHAEARMAVFEFIEGWYNPRRRHSAIGYLSPVNYERSQLPPARPNP